MASISLAMVQGQKNAQDLAKSQLSTMADMAKSAEQFDTTMDYFDPSNKALRDLKKRDTAERVKAIVENEQLIKELDLDPNDAAGKVMNKINPMPGGWELKKHSDGSMVLEASYQPVAPSGEEQPYQVKSIPVGSSMAEVKGLLSGYLTKTNLDRLSGIDARYAATEASKLKQLEDYQKAVNKLTYEINPLTASQERQTGMRVRGGLDEAAIGAEATKTAAQIRAEGGITEKNISMGYHAKEVDPAIQAGAVKAMGGSVIPNAEGKPVFKIPANIDGKDVMVDLDMAPPDVQAAVNQVASVGSNAFYTAANRKENPVVAGNIAMQQAAAARKNPVVQPTAGIPLAKSHGDTPPVSGHTVKFPAGSSPRAGLRVLVGAPREVTPAAYPALPATATTRQILGF